MCPQCPVPIGWTLPQSTLWILELDVKSRDGDRYLTVCIMEHVIMRLSTDFEASFNYLWGQISWIMNNEFEWTDIVVDVTKLNDYHKEWLLQWLIVVVNICLLLVLPLVLSAAFTYLTTHLCFVSLSACVHAGSANEPMPSSPVTTYPCSVCYSVLKYSCAGWMVEKIPLVFALYLISSLPAAIALDLLKNFSLAVQSEPSYKPVRPCHLIWIDVDRSRSILVCTTVQFWGRRRASLVTLVDSFLNGF